MDITITPTGRYHIKYVGGVKPNIVLRDICKNLFCKLYCVGHTYIDEMIFEIKVRAPLELIY